MGDLFIWAAPFPGQGQQARSTAKASRLFGCLSIVVHACVLASFPLLRLFVWMHVFSLSCLASTPQGFNIKSWAKKKRVREELAKIRDANAMQLEGSEPSSGKGENMSTSKKTS